MVGQKDKTNDAINLDESITTIKNYIQKGEIIADNDLKVEEETEEEKKLPIVGILGFSQGAAFGGVVAHKFHELFETDPLKFVVLYSGFKLDTSKRQVTTSTMNITLRQKKKLKVVVSNTFTCWESWTLW